MQLMNNIFKSFTVLFLSFFPILLAAQALPFTAIDYNAASLGKGGTSLVQTSSISGTAFTNAAAIPFSDLKADVTAGFAIWAPGGVSTNVLSVTGAYNVKQKLGVAVGLAYGMNPSYDVVDATGTVPGQFKPSEMQLSAGLSYRFLPFLSVGANVGYATSKLAENASYGSLVADVFLMAKFGGFKLAAGVSELPRQTSFLLSNIFVRTFGKSLLLQPAQWFVLNFKEKHIKEVQKKATNSYSLLGKLIK